MSATRSKLIVFIVLLAAAIPATAAENIEEILAKHLEALGGAEAIRAVHTITIHADIEILGMGVTGSMESQSVMPCFYHSVLSLGFFNVKQGYDGSRIWRVDPNRMLLILKDEQSIRDQVTRCIIDSYSYLFPRDDLSMRAAGIDTIDGTACAVIELEPEGGAACRLYIDSDTYLLKRLSMDTGSGALHETYGDYRKIDGLMAPFLSRMHQPAMNQTVEIRIRTLTVNEQIDPVLFLPPSSAAKDYMFLEGSSATLIPFTYYENHIYLPVRFAGSDAEVMFMLDSGASMTVVDSTFTVEMGFPIGERMVGAGAGGTANFYMTKVPGFSIEGVSFDEQTVIAYPIRQIMSRFVDVEVQGILGYDFLSRFVSRIDYERSILTLYEPDSAAGTAPLDAPLIHNVFSVEGMVDGLYGGTFLIDTGAGNSMLQKGFSEKNGLFANRSKVEISIMGAGGEESAYLARFDSFEIGGITIEKPLFALSTAERGIGAFPGISGIIGNDILQRFTVTLDYRHQRIGLEKNRFFDSPVAKDRSGIVLERDASNRVLIHRIVPGSSADEAGLLPGDILLYVDHRDVADFDSMEDILDRFRVREEIEIEIEIDREGERLHISLTLRDYL